MTEPHEVEQAYQQAVHGSLAVRHPDPGLIRLTGRDRLELLNRMSTNKVDDLAPGKHAATVLTNPVGQTVDVLEVLALDGQLILVTSPNRGQQVFDWLSKYIFFQDQVVPEIIGADWSLWGCYGPDSPEAAAWILGGRLPSAGKLAEVDGGLVWEAPRVLAPGLRLLLDPAASSRAEDQWPLQGPGSASAAAFEILRVERGAPAPGREIQDDTIPLEAGLWDAVSFSKGCYIGQEIIARLESRGRLAKQLVGIRLEGEAALESELIQAGHRVGRLSSLAHSSSLGWIGLALAQPMALETDDGRVLVGDQKVPAQIHPLPLASRESRPA